MKTGIPIISLTALGMLAWSPETLAADCSGTTLTGTCTPSGKAVETCTQPAAIECDAMANCNPAAPDYCVPNGAYMWAIEDSTTTFCGGEFCIWGEDANGGAFCCSYSGCGSAIEPASSRSRQDGLRGLHAGEAVG